MGDVFTWRVFERERNGTLQLLASASETGGPAFGKDGTPNPPLIISLSWAADKDKDTLRFEIDAAQAFTTEVFIDWVA